MPLTDIFLVIRWWGTLFLVGAAAYPLTRRMFHQWHDQGYFLTKAVGFAAVTWVVYVMGMARIAPFGIASITLSLILVFILGSVASLMNHESARLPAPDRRDGGQGIVNHEKNKNRFILQHSVFLIQGRKAAVNQFILIVIEELFFLAALLFWSFIKAHEPSIRGLEKFMDYGFMQSILNSTYFPPADMWYPPYAINYYYFGHLVTALLTKLSGMDLGITFNLMLATIFALCLTMSFSIGAQLFRMSSMFRDENYELGIRNHEEKKRKIMLHNSLFMIMSGTLTAFLVTLAGNMQTIYAFTKGYTGEDVKPFWNLFWTVPEFFSRVYEGLNIYWYANATRFIPFTIHEFPSYSFVVSDIHGHVLSIPFVLLAIGLLIVMFGRYIPQRENHELARLPAPDRRDGGQGILNHEWVRIGFYGFLCGVLLMTNALDGPIYLGLFFVLFIIHNSQFIIQWKKYWVQIAVNVGSVVGAAILTSLPFLSHFKSFVNGVAVNCPLPILANTKVGPLLFEGVEKCQHSPLWMMWLLWGFFWFCGAAFLFRKLWKTSITKGFSEIWSKKFTHIDKLMVVFFAFSLVLIIFPEFFYFKDIYPMHFRSNTMFKLGYQAFIMLSIMSAYVIASFFIRDPHKAIVHRRSRFPFRLGGRFWFMALLIPQIFLVSIYPLFSVRSYFGGLERYEGLYGFTWLFREYPDDFAAMQWLKNQVISHQSSVISRSESRRLKADSSFSLVEADGDSYTDYERFSVFTGIATPIGWAVHEWLWRGTYDVVAPRREEVRLIYESEDVGKTRDIIRKYGVRFVVVGALERKKFSALDEQKFLQLGGVVFRRGETVLYEITN